jgi:hypothetical protein
MKGMMVGGPTLCGKEQALSPEDHCGNRGPSLQLVKGAAFWFHGVCCRVGLRA